MPDCSLSINHFFQLQRCKFVIGFLEIKITDIFGIFNSLNAKFNLFYFIFLHFNFYNHLQAKFGQLFVSSLSSEPSMKYVTLLVLLAKSYEHLKDYY